MESDTTLSSSPESPTDAVELNDQQAQPVLEPYQSILAVPIEPMRSVNINIPPARHKQDYWPIFV